MSSLTESTQNPHNSTHDSHARPRPPPPPADNRMQSDSKRMVPNTNPQPHPPTGRPPTRPPQVANGPNPNVHTRTDQRPVSNNNNNNVNTRPKVPFGSRSVDVSVYISI